MFRDRDLPLRLLAALLPAPAGYALTRSLTPLLDGARHRSVVEAVQRHAAELLGDRALAEAAGRDFAGAIACDDLDAVTAWLWPESLRRVWLRVEGEEHLPPPGRAVFATFHISGGFRIYDVLRARGFRPTVLAAPPAPGGNRYRRWIDRARFAYLGRVLADGFLPVGPNAARKSLRSPAAHLARGGAVVAVLDVSPATLGLRESATTELLGRRVELPNGLLRLAASAGIPVVPFDARLERGRRVVRFHPQIVSRDAQVLLDGVVRALEGSIRSRPWDWQAWIDVHRLLAPRAATAPQASTAMPGAPSPPIAIVVPIHDAADDVRRCLASVRAHAPRDARVILVDDASTDPALCAELDQIARRDPRVTLLRNRANEGFVRSANRGLAEAGESDVVLLNSDTVVPAHFVERLRHAAHHTPATGIVSPFTNNGTIFSLPEFMIDNPLPEGLDVDGMAGLVAATSLHRRPEVYTAHGFCMYVRAALLARVGRFDEERFGRGYGEENDLCERARLAGFEIRLCDDLFVYHRGGASFGEGADALAESHLATLEALHPGYRAGVQSFIAANPLAELQANVKYHLARRALRPHPGLLFVLHASPFSDARRENIGGTQYHVLDLVRSLALPRALVAWPAADGTSVAEIAGGDVDRPLLHRFVHDLPPGEASARRFVLRDPAWESALGSIVDLLDVGAAHIHHLAFWPVGLWRVLGERGIPFAYTAQDYYAVCPSWNLLDLATVARCACTGGSPEDRRRCLASWFEVCALPAPQDPEALLRAHRAEFGALLESAQVRIAACDATRTIVERAFPDRRLSWHRIPYGVERRALAARERAPGPLRVALLGAVAAPWKGAAQVLEAMRSTRDLALEWQLFGDCEAFDFPARARAATGDPARLRFHGRYARDEIVDLLLAHDIDLSLLLSPWDETFCYTLSESWNAGVPAIVSDRGALAERTRATGAGIVARDSAEVERALRDLALHPERLEPLARAARERDEPTPAENAARHREAYGGMLQRLAPHDREPAFGAPDRLLFEAHLRARSD